MVKVEPLTAPSSSAIAPPSPALAELVSNVQSMIEISAAAAPVPRIAPPSVAAVLPVKSQFEIVVIPLPGIASMAPPCPAD